MKAPIETNRLDNYSLNLLSGVDDTPPLASPLKGRDGRYTIDFFLMAFLVNLEAAAGRAQIHEAIKVFLEDLRAGLSIYERAYLYTSGTGHISVPLRIGR